MYFGQNSVSKIFLKNRFYLKNAYIFLTDFSQASIHNFFEKEKTSNKKGKPNTRWKL